MNTDRALEKTRRDYRDFQGLVQSRGSLLDLFLIGVVPLVLVAVWLLPGWVRQTLVLDPGGVGWWAVYTSAFVHLDTWHLLGNLFGYLLVVSLLYLICLRIDRVALFRGFHVFFLVFIPVVTSVAHLVYLDIRTMGFSGVNAAYTGFLAVALALYTAHGYGEAADAENHGDMYVLGLVWFLVGVLFFSVVYTGVSFASLVLSVLLAAVLIHQYINNKLHSHIEGIQHLATSRIDLLLLSAAIAVYLGSLPGMYPEEIVTGDSAVNIFVHITGFYVGFFTSYFYVTWR